MKIYAHRGCHKKSIGQIHENSIEAFLLAQKLGADGIETDLRVTGDGIVILFHDDVSDGRPVSEIGYAELCVNEGYQVATLKDISSRLWSLAWNLEIKTHSAWERLKNEISKWPKTMTVTSFLHDVAIDAMKEGVPSGVLVAHAPDRLSRLTGDDIPRLIVWDWKAINEDIIKEHAANGGVSWVYGIGDVESHKKAMVLPIEVIITDHLEDALELRTDQK